MKKFVLVALVGLCSVSFGGQNYWHVNCKLDPAGCSCEEICQQQIRIKPNGDLCPSNDKKSCDEWKNEQMQKEIQQCINMCKKRK